MKKFIIPLFFVCSVSIADENRDFIDHMLNDMFEIYGPKNSQPQVDPEFIQQIQNKLNNRFMKVLNYKTPNELLIRHRKNT